MAPWRKDQVRKLVVAVHKGQRERKPLVRVFREFAPDNHRHWTACQKKWHYLPDAEKRLTKEEEEGLRRQVATGVQEMDDSRISIQWTNITGPGDYENQSEVKEGQIPTTTENKENENENNGEENENDGEENENDGEEKENDGEENENDGEENENDEGENENNGAESEKEFPLRRAQW